LTGAKHPAFSTNQLADTNKTKQLKGHCFVCFSFWLRVLD